MSMSHRVSASCIVMPSWPQPSPLTEGVASTLRVMGLRSQSPTDCSRVHKREAGWERMHSEGH
jgi:hypothetical protein